MIFHSPAYLLFLAGVFVLSACAGRRRWAVLLLASAYFYVSLGSPHLTVALALVTGMSYFAGIGLTRCATETGRKRLFVLGVVANLLVLVFLKYLPFLSNALNALLGFVSPAVSVPEPGILASIGVSYYVFQAVSYLVDIYLEVQEPERHPGYFALYLAFFPKLLQGPIERAEALLPQLRIPYTFDYDNVRAGLLMFSIGLFKKVVVADRLAFVVDAVYGDVHAHAGIPTALATLFYAFQLYCDFSGYTDMALGSARVFNIRLTPNFNGPYLATSVADFWRRWHITFSRFILDYIFRPLQMRYRDHREYGTALALLLTFLVSGLWHGAGWGFILWGLLHGTYLAASVFYRPYRKRIYDRLGWEDGAGRRIWQGTATFCLVCFAWIFFRANTVSDAFYAVTHLWDIRGAAPFFVTMGTKLAIGTLLIALILAVDVLHGRMDLVSRLWAMPRWRRWAIYYALLLSVIYRGADVAVDRFLYFQF